MKALLVKHHMGNGGKAHIDKLFALKRSHGSPLDEQVIPVESTSEQIELVKDHKQKKHKGA